MDYVALKTEIALPAYAAMTVEQIVAALNASTIQVQRPVDPADVCEVLMEVGAWEAIELHSRRPPVGVIGDMTGENATVGALLALVRAVDQQRMLRFDRDAVRTRWGTRLQAIQSAGFITTAQRLRLVNLAQTTISRAQQLGLPAITGEDVKTARQV